MVCSVLGRADTPRLYALDAGVEADILYFDKAVGNHPSVMCWFLYVGTENRNLLKTETYLLLATQRA